MQYRKLFSIGPLGSLLMLVLSAGGEELKTVQDTDPSVWETSRRAVGGLWERSQTLAGKAWEDTRRWLGDGGDDFGRVWEGIVPKLEQTLALEDRQERLPERAWFGTDRQDNRADIHALLDESIAILTLSPSQGYRERIRELEGTIRKAEEDMAQLRTRRVTAPRDSLWEKTLEQYDGEIQERQARIRDARNELAALRKAFATELQSLGLQVSDEQLEFLLSTVIGDDLLDLGIAFDNVKAITAQLEQLMLGSENDLESGRRYYGMYTVLLKILERMQARLLASVEQDYLPHIDAIAEKTRRLMGDTRGLQQRSADHRTVLAANLEAQELTLRAADLYRHYLVEQAREVTAARQRLAQDIAIAQNTYETVKVTGELVALMHSSQRLLDSLLSRQAPPLRAFQNLEMKREFEKLTALLKQREAT